MASTLQTADGSLTGPGPRGIPEAAAEGDPRPLKNVGLKPSFWVQHALVCYPEGPDRVLFLNYVAGTIYFGIHIYIYNERISTLYICIYIYIHTLCMYTYVYIHMYMYIHIRMVSEP